MKKKIVIAGATGFVGKYLVGKYQELGYDVKIISRQLTHITWNNKALIVSALEDAEMLINLAGKSVNCRYTAKNKREILESRVDTTKILGDAILSCKVPPPVWINSSTATIYRHAEDRPMTEANGDIGEGFSVDVATNWEKAFFDFKLANTRQVALRMAIVLGKNGGVIIPIKNLVRLGLGGRQGNGMQMFSWVHIEDVYQTIAFVQAHQEISGVYNLSSPNPITNEIFMSTFRKIMKMPFGLPSPKWLLKIGAVIIKTETELILKSRWVIPEKLIAAGYNFKYATLEDALKNILTS